VSSFVFHSVVFQDPSHQLFFCTLQSINLFDGIRLDQPGECKGIHVLRVLLLMHALLRYYYLLIMAELASAAATTSPRRTESHAVLVSELFR